MRLKKNNKTKKYALGGVISGIASLGQLGLGLYQTMQGQAMAKDVKEASTARPSEYAEMLKLSRQSDLERKRLDELNRSLSTGIGAAQSAGGRALIGALPGMVRAGDVGTQDILAQRQNAQMAALQQASMGAEREINRNLTREQQQLAMAQAVVEGGLQNIGGGAGQLGKAAMLGVFDKPGTQPPAATSVKKLKGSTIGGGFGSPAAALTADNWEEEQQSILMAQEGGMVTEGKFSHKTNPINLVRGNNKIGEMTGGEVILNPSQQAKLSKESAYFRNLLKKFNKKK